MRKARRRVSGRKIGKSTRRDFLKGIGASGFLGGVSSLIPFAAPRAANDIEGELVYADSGGGNQKEFEEKFFPEFSKRYGGIKITYVTGSPAENVAKVRAQKDNPQIDVMRFGGGLVFPAISEGLLADIDRSLIPNLQLARSFAGEERAAAPIGLTLSCLCINTAEFAKRGLPEPTSWFDLWDPKYQGHVGSYSINIEVTSSVLVTVAKSLTGDYKNFDPAFAKFKELHPVDFYTSAGAAETAMMQGDLWVMVQTAARTLQLKNSGAPVKIIIPKEGAVGSQTWLGVVKNAPHPKAAHAWIDFMLSTDGQQRMLEYLGYYPVNDKTTIPAAMSDYFPDVNKVFIPDWRYISTQNASIVDRWNRIVER